MDIDNKKYKINRENHYVTKFKKRQIILAGSLRKENFHIKRLQKKDFGKTKKWPTYSISREGKIFQHFDPKFYSDFMGDKDIDKQSISIMLENMGMIFFDYEANSFLNSLHEKCLEDNIYEKNWRGFSYCESYTEKQYDSVLELSIYLCESLTIPKDSFGFNVFHKEAAKFNGVVTRSNFNSECTDLNPSFNFKQFYLDIKK